MLDVAIIGCGVVGAAAAYELSHYPLHTAIFEAENDVADCTTKANSAILHAGYDPEPGTRMARLNVEGVALAKEICARLDVPYRQCGSLVLALSPAELPHLQKLYENGLANGVPGIRLLSAEETRAMEPGLSPEVAGALYAPSAAIVSPWEYALARGWCCVCSRAACRCCWCPAWYCFCCCAPHRPMGLTICCARRSRARSMRRSAAMSRPCFCWRVCSWA